MLFRSIFFSVFLVIFTLPQSYSGFSDAGSVGGSSLGDDLSSGYSASDIDADEAANNDDGDPIQGADDNDPTLDATNSMAMAQAGGFGQHWTNDLGNGLDHSLSWIPIPFFDYFNRRVIIQMAHPEDRMHYRRRHQVFTGSPNNHHQFTHQRTKILGFSIINGHVATFGGIGPGAAIYHKRDKTYNEIASSYDDASLIIPKEIPKTYEDILSWPDHTVMSFGSQNFGQLIVMAGAFFQGVDLRAILKKGFIVRVHKKPRKIAISFLTRSTVGARAGYFSSIIMQGFRGTFRNKIFSYTFEFATENPSEESKRACTSILSKHDLDSAFHLSEASNSGVRKRNQTLETEIEKADRFSIGFPIIGRYSKSNRAKTIKAKQEIDGEIHEIQKFLYHRKTRSRLIRRRKKGTSEPVIMQNHKIKETQALGFIDKQPNEITQIGAQISYSFEFDSITIQDLSKTIEKLSKKLFLDQLSVAFPSETPKGSAILKLDILLEQGSIYALRHFAKTDPHSFKKKAVDFLTNYLHTNKTKFNPFYNPESGLFSSHSTNVIKHTILDLDKLIEILVNFSPSRNRTELSPEAHEVDQIKKLGEIANIIYKNHFMLITLQSLGIDLFKFHYELKGEFFSPYIINF